MLIGELQSWDERRDLIIPGDEETTLAFCAEHWIHTAKRSIQQKGRFAVALSGGSTPKAIYARIAKDYKEAIDWGKVHLFWSDERDVPLDHPDSNYHMAMTSGFSSLPIPPAQIHPLRTTNNLERCASEYEDLINRILGSDRFDLVMLGIGEDGHTASLFPHTKALDEKKHLSAANFLPEQNKWRLTLTFSAIEQSSHTTIYAIGTSKQAIVPLILNAAVRSPFPASAIGTVEKKCLWIMDLHASRLLKK